MALTVRREDFEKEQVDRAEFGFPFTREIHGREFTFDFEVYRNLGKVMVRCTTPPADHELKWSSIAMYRDMAVLCDHDAVVEVFRPKIEKAFS